MAIAVVAAVAVAAVAAPVGKENEPRLARAIRDLIPGRVTVRARVESWLPLLHPPPP
jgi:hypothetical protein